MSVEELKMLVELARNLGDAASTTVLWWLALKYGSVLASYLCLCATVITVVWLAARTYQRTNEWILLAQEVARAHGAPFVGDWLDPGARLALSKAIAKAKG